MYFEQPRHKGMEQLGLHTDELDMYLEEQGITPPAALELGTTAVQESVEPPFDSSDPYALQEALDTLCVDTGD